MIVVPVSVSRRAFSLTGSPTIFCIQLVSFTHFLKMALNFISLLKITSNEDEAALFLQEKGIIYRERVCECGSAMRPSTRSTYGKQIPVWLCTTRACNKRKGLRPNTWLDPSKLPLDTIVHFIYWWARDQTSILFCERELGMDHSTTTDWSNYLREVCASLLLTKQNGAKIGEVGMTVEIDESLFSKNYLVLGPCIMI